MFVRCKVDQSLYGIGNIRTACAAIGRYRGCIGVNHLRLHVQSRDLVNTPHGDRQISSANESAHHAVVGPRINPVLESNGQYVAFIV